MFAMTSIAGCNYCVLVIVYSQQRAYKCILLVHIYVNEIIIHVRCTVKRFILSDETLIGCKIKVHIDLAEYDQRVCPI